MTYGAIVWMVAPEVAVGGGTIAKGSLELIDWGLFVLVNGDSSTRCGEPNFSGSSEETPMYDQLYVRMPTVCELLTTVALFVSLDMASVNSDHSSHSLLMLISRIINWIIHG